MGTSGWLYRGVSRDLCADDTKYKVGQQFHWWGCTSCSVDAEVAKRFSKPVGGGVGTIFTIITSIGVDIHAYSSMTHEKEVLLPPGMTFMVKSRVLNAGGYNH